MPKKHWFYIMLALPLALPLSLCLLAHLLYHVLPDPGFSYVIENSRIRYDFANGHAETGADGLLDYITAPVAIYPTLIALIVEQSLALSLYYIIFAAFVVWWTHAKPFHFVKRIVWKLPLIYYPFFLIGGIMEYSLGWLHVQIVALPMVLVVGYLYVTLAWAIVPARYKNARPL